MGPGMVIATIVMGVLALVLTVLAYRKGGGQHVAGLKAAMGMTVQILPLLVFAFIMAGMVQVLLPREVMAKWIGTESGLELVKQLAELDENTRIVMLTGYASVATAVEAIKLGAVHYLAKPANADDVVAALQRTEGDATVTPVATPLSVKSLEWEHLQKVLMEHDGNISAAARALKMHRRTLQRKLAKHPVRE